MSGRDEDSRRCANVCQLMKRNIHHIGRLLEEQACLADSLLEGGDALTACGCAPAGAQGQALREALLETIQTLEESKKAFKSKQLEALRKKLIRVLAQAD
ncbi:hypothetical protein SAMN02745206_02994 [Desulfacinum infernum DSM 9756]|uniref:Uncharacterized protein n=2 Tax=Desulfacinum infernum TaxID=35837 RepID=A0A1M5FWF7_9BACT|nr:hypothetical protein SAMN02745206_02994 [Desulfacinum infernum DSM 9756]